VNNIPFDSYASDPIDTTGSYPYTVEVSGKTEQMPTGAQRDSQEGRGRFDLIPPGPIARLALVYERGAKAYGERNWEKGMKFSRLLNSTLRHISKYMLGKKEEDHIVQAIWNLMAVAHFQDHLPELNDLPAWNVPIYTIRAITETNVDGDKSTLDSTNIENVPDGYVVDSKGILYRILHYDPSATGR